MAENSEQIYMEQSETFENGYTAGETVYYTGTIETFEDGDRLEHGMQGEVVDPATCEELMGKGVAVQFSGNKGAIACRHQQLPVALADPPPKTHR